LSWLQPAEEIAAIETANWQALTNAAPSHPLLKTLTARLQGKRVRASLHHGDFAPWNVKVDKAGRWTVLDWERGEVRGLPLWDWLHFIIQREVLIRRPGLGGLIDVVESLLRSPAVLDYSKRAACAGIERELTLAYLLHVSEIIRPAEGLPENRRLLDELAARWLSS
jgi:aminoglycoside phosphotransferase (APT) family kinase protein